MAIKPTGLTAVAGNLLTSNQASNSSSTGSVAVTITTPTAGHLLVLGAAANASASAVSFTAPSGWSTLYADAAFTFRWGVALFYKIADGTEGPTVTVTSSGTAMDAIYEEVSGNAGTSPGDQSGHATGATPVALATGGATAQANEIAFVIAHSTDHEQLDRGYRIQQSEPVRRHGGRVALLRQVLTATGTVSTSVSQISATRHSRPPSARSRAAHGRAEPGGRYLHAAGCGRDGGRHGRAGQRYRNDHGRGQRRDCAHLDRRGGRGPLPGLFQSQR